MASLTITLATLATQFLERPGLAPSTLRSYELTLIPLLKEYGRWSVEILDRELLTEYLNSLSHLKYTTHHRHQAILLASLQLCRGSRLYKLQPHSATQTASPLP